MKTSTLALGISGLFLTCLCGCPPAAQAPLGKGARSRGADLVSSDPQRSEQVEAKERAKDETDKAEEKKEVNPNLPPPPPPPPPAPQPPPPPPR
ncbi:Hypothetical protein A7982_04718 [Minicystis rosea]|nr:Hypothetical protein A7982_04718 [Minicystis rosea]